MKHAIWIFLATYTAVMVVACSKSSDSGGSSAAIVNTGCPAGTTFINGACYNAQGQAVNGSGVAYKADNFRVGGVNISNSSVFTRFLGEALAICDQGAYNAGLAACSTFASGYVQVIFQSVNTANNTARITVEVQPRAMNYGYYYVSTPTWGQAGTCGITMLLGMGCWMAPTANQMQYSRNPLSLDLVVSLINNSKGFEARNSAGAYGTLSGLKWIQLMVTNGKLGDNTLNYQLFYDGQAGGPTPMLSGTMSRCNDASCGVYYY